MGGRWLDAQSGETFDVHDPSTETVVASVARLGADEAKIAVDVAQAAFGAWRQKLPQERAEILNSWHDLIRTAAPDLALLMTVEQGKPFRESQDEIAYAASFVRWFAEEGRRLNVEGITAHLPCAEAWVRREPLGVVAAVTPWNFPAAMLTRKAAAALAAGCTVVAHPSSWTPLSALALAELADRAGLPPGVFNVVPGDAEAIVSWFSADVRVRGMSFTGSTEIGRRVAAQCAATMKRMVMELGGHAPLLVFADADLEQAVEIAIAAKFTTSGQDCLAANRILVQRPIYQPFCEALATRISTLRVGPGLQPGVDIGPLMHRGAVVKVGEHVKDACQRGARCVVGGVSQGQFFPPTLLVDVPRNALIMHEETFGPVAAVSPFDSEEEVVAYSNATEYGLIAYVVTQDIGRALRLSRALEYGMVAVNRASVTGAPVPFGGLKQSGLGREGSRHGIEAFTDLKYICLGLKD